MYCAHTNTKLVNELRYKMFCGKNGDISSGKLPPCSDATWHDTLQHTHPAIWRRSLENSPTVPSPTDGHGWNILDGQLEICWLTCAPATEVVLELMSCRCSRNCDKDCPCVMNGLRCTPACKLQECTNMQHDDDDDDDDDDRSNDLDESDSESEKE